MSCVRRQPKAVFFSLMYVPMTKLYKVQYIRLSIYLFFRLWQDIKSTSSCKMSSQQATMVDLCVCSRSTGS